MSKSTLILSLISSALVAQASTVTVVDTGFSDNFVNSTNFSADVATIGVLGASQASVSDDPNLKRTSSFTVVGFDFNSDGTADTLTYDVIQTGVLGTINNSGTRGVGVNGNGNGGINAFGTTGEVLLLTVDNVAIALGGGAAGSYSGTFNGFTQANLIHGGSSGGASDWAINIGSQAGSLLDSGTTSGTSLDPSVVFAATNTIALSNLGTVEHFRAQSVDYTFTVSLVPEPSAYALLSGLMVLGWIVIRRRR